MSRLVVVSNRVADPRKAAAGGLAVATWCCAIAAVAGASVGTLVGGWEVPTVREGVALVVLGVVLTAVAFGLWYFAVARLGADRAGVLIGLMPVAGLVASVALGEHSSSEIRLVRKTTGSLRKSGWVRNCRQRMPPFMPGISMSSRTRCGRNSIATCNARAGSLTSRTSAPRVADRARRIIRVESG